jgi:acyl-CoA thioester hydrolase
VPPPFRFSHVIEVRFRDVDMLGHVNNAVYLSYLEQARMVYLQGLGLRDRHPKTILVRNEIDYKHPIHLNDTLEVFVRVARIGTKSLEFAYLVHANGLTCAVASSVHVWYDFEAARSVPVPLEARQRIAAFEAEPSSHLSQTP